MKKAAERQPFFLVYVVYSGYIRMPWCRVTSKNSK